MDIPKILAELRAERAQIEEAILSLERLALGRKRGPGRPRTSSNYGAGASIAETVAAVAGIAPRRRGRPPGSKNKTRTTATLTAGAGPT